MNTEPLELDILRIWQDYQIERLWELCFPKADKGLFYNQADTNKGLKK